jgi:hypothetical protein
MVNDKFTAKEAKLIADCRNAELLEVLSAIEHGAEQGRYELKLYEDMTDATIEKLTDRGFKVIPSVVVNGLNRADIYHTIQW